MKVCFIAHASNLTGASRSLLDMLNGLEGTSVKPIVLLPAHGPLEVELQKKQIPYKIIRYVTEIASKHWTKNAAKKLINKAALPRLTHFLQEEQIDLVHNNCYMSGVGMDAARYANVPYICHLRELVQEDHHLQFLDENKQIQRLKQAAKAISISHFVNQKYSKQAPEQSMVTLYDGMNINDYLDSEKTVFQNPSVNILLAGRISPGKGQLEAVQAARIMYDQGFRDFSLKIIGGIGDAHYADEVNKAAEELEQVQFCQFIKDLRELRRKSDINLVCSTAEAMGRVTIESQLAGCLTIGAAVGATPELLEDGKTGLLYPSGKPEELAKRIIYAAENRKEMQKIACEGRAYAMKTYDTKMYGKKIEQLYLEVLDTAKINK